MPEPWSSMVIREGENFIRTSACLMLKFIELEIWFTEVRKREAKAIGMMVLCVFQGNDGVPVPEEDTGSFNRAYRFTHDVPENTVSICRPQDGG
ncbi:MAG: hypothetical protein ACN6OP_18015 [Pseudomonadales bacterium]